MQRLGHFGFNVRDQEEALRFYSDLLGLPVTDTRNFGQILDLESESGQDPNGYFLRVGADHHSVVLFPHWTYAAGPAPKREGVEWISHIAWQVAATVAFAWLGALSAWPGLLGLLVSVASWAGLAAAQERATRAGSVAEVALRRALGDAYARELDTDVDPDRRIKYDRVFFEDA